MERWRKPMPFVVIGPTADTETIGDRRYSGIEIGISEESWARIRAGYLCTCGEPHERPWPKACPVCKLSRYSLKARLGELFTGVIGEGESYEDEEARLAELNDRRMYRPGSSILLPPGVTLD